MAGPIHIALTFDDGFWAPAYATMRSVALSSERPGDLVFHLLHKQLSAAHRAVLDDIPAEFPGIRLTDHPIDTDPHFAAMKAGFVFKYRRLNDMVLARLIFDRLLPSEVARLIYLDCDVMVRSPIETVVGRRPCWPLGCRRHRSQPAEGYAGHRFPRQGATSSLPPGRTSTAGCC